MLGLTDELAPHCGAPTLSAVGGLAVDKDGPHAVIKHAEQPRFVGLRVGVGPEQLLAIATKRAHGPHEGAGVVVEPSLEQRLAHVIEWVAVRGSSAVVVEVHQEQQHLVHQMVKLILLMQQFKTQHYGLVLEVQYLHQPLP